MANNKKISQLTVAGTLDGTELVPVVKAGVTVQTTTQDIADLGGTTPTLQEVITESPLINGNLALSLGQTTAITLDENEIILSSSDGVPTHYSDITINENYLYINSEDEIQLTAPSVTKNGVEIATVNDIPSISGLLVASSNLSDVANPLTARNNLKDWDFKLSNGDQSTTSNVATNITDLVFTPPTVSKRYSFHGILHIGCSSTGGVKFQVTIPTGATIWMSFEGLQNSSVSRQWFPVTASATLTSNAFCTTNSAASYVVVSGEVQMGATAGNIQFGFASGTNTQTSTVYQLGSLLTIKQLD